MRIFIAEDEALVALELEMSLEDLGATVVGSAATLKSALELAKVGSFDAAVLDICLGDKDSFSVAFVLRARQIPFVFVSGHAMREEIETLFPTATLLSKPCSPEVILQALEKEVGGNSKGGALTGCGQP